MAQLEAKLTVGTGDEESETEYGKSVISLKKIQISDRYCLFLGCYIAIDIINFVSDF
jgi:hypothetical protein